ncbi:MAG TPA: hypothetical protein DCO86_03195 [Spirochaetaceae bacterium]|nr:hypothetical protein [Spirochaetaceae bacterium]
MLSSKIGNTQSIPDFLKRHPDSKSLRIILKIVSGRPPASSGLFFYRAHAFAAAAFVSGRGNAQSIAAKHCRFAIKQYCHYNHYNSTM